MADKPFQSITIPELNNTYVNIPPSTASNFDTLTAYAVNDIVFYNRKLYKFVANHAAGAWNNSHVEEITIGNEIKQIENDLSQKYEKPSTGIPASDIASGVIPDVSSKTDKVQSATSGNFASLDSNGNLTDSGHKHSDYLTEAPVTDVQINETSVLDAYGVAKVPNASSNNYGAVLIGNGLQISSSSGKLMTLPAGSSQVKAGLESFMQITPNMQHQSAFYGLAKAAGDTTQSSSSNAVGTYTDDAKIKIQKMLGIYEAPWELIREDTFTNETEADHVITVDGNGNAFELTDTIILFETPKQDTYSSKGVYGQIHLLHDTSIISQPECGAWTQEANTNSHGCGVIFERKGTLCIVTTLRQTTTSNTMTMGIRFSSGLISSGNGIIVSVLNINKIIIKAVTGTGHYRLYGKRKWS